MAENKTQCPKCGSDALYRYGKTNNHKKRKLCLVCGRQFIVERSVELMPNRPNCPSCKEPMHVYQRGKTFIRFRCRNYPACRQYLKIDI